MVDVGTTQRRSDPSSDAADGHAPGEAPTGRVAAVAAGPVRALSSLRSRVRARRGGALAWRIGVTIVGVAIVVGGIILLPLPGPGWLIIFAGLGVLATEYEWAARLLTFAREQVGRWTSWAGRQPRWIQALVGVLGLAFLAAVFYVVYLLLY